MNRVYFFSYKNTKAWTYVSTNACNWVVCFHWSCFSWVRKREQKKVYD